MIKSTLDFINTIAQSVAAIGTLAAVIVALYLARRQTAERVTVTTAKVGIVTPGIPGSNEGFFLRIAITNSCLRDVTLTGIGWRVGWWRPERFFQLLPLNELSSILPKRLAPSETALFFYPWDDYVVNALPLRRALGTDLRGRVRARMTKCEVFLSTGVVCRATIDSYVVTELLKSPVVEG